MSHTASFGKTGEDRAEGRPGAESRQAAEGDCLPAALIIGPVPPPFHGNAVFTRLLLQSPELRRHYRPLHLDTSDRRTLANMGRLDVRNVLLALRHAATLGWLLAARRPAVVYLGISQNALAYLRDAVLLALARAFRCPVAIHLHGSDFAAFYARSGPLVRWLVRRSTRSVGAAGVLGPTLRGQFSGLVASSRVRVAPAGIPDPGEPPARPSHRQVTVLYLGMLYRPKGIIDLLEAAALAVATEPSLTFLMVGEWFSEEDRRETAAVMRRLALKDLVRFPGPVDGAAKAALWSGVDLLVFPGYQPEGLPLVILEAMAAGLPVIATRVGAVADAVTDGETGLLVPTRDPAALADAMTQLARDAGLRARLGAMGRQRFREAYTEGACMKAVVALLDAARESAAR